MDKEKGKEKDHETEKEQTLARLPKSIVRIGRHRKRSGPAKFGVRVKRWGLQIRVGCRFPDSENARIVRDAFNNCIHFDNTSGRFSFKAGSLEEYASSQVSRFIKFSRDIEIGPWEMPRRDNQWSVGAKLESLI